MVPAEPADVRPLLALAYQRPPRTPNWALRAIHREMFEPRAPAQRALIDELVAGLERYAAQREALGVPTLLIWGRNDPVFPLPIAERLSAMWPGASLVIIEDAHHSPNLEHPGTFNETLARFLD